MTIDTIKTVLQLSPEVKLYSEIYKVKEAKAVVVLCHGYSEHCGRYDHVIDFLNKEGYSVYTFDQPHHGRNPGLKGVILSIDDWVRSVELMVAKARSESPGQLLFLLGHSAGALTSVLYATGPNPDIDGLILSAPPVFSDIRPWMQSIAYLLARVIPYIPLVHVGAEDMLTHDEKIRAKTISDELCYLGRLRAITGYALLAGTKRVQENVTRLTSPLLVMQGTADKWVRPDGASFLTERANSKDKKLIEYDGFYHEIFNEVGREKVLSDMGQWIKERL